jgi:hypothetical protein
VTFDTGWLFAGKAMRPQADKARAKNHDLKNRRMLLSTKEHHRIEFSLSTDSDSFSTILGGYFRKASGKMKNRNWGSHDGNRAVTGSGFSE